MTTRVCPYCKEGKDTRGFNVHVKACEEKLKLSPLRKRYAGQLASMSEEAGIRFLRKAGGWDNALYPKSN